MRILILVSAALVLTACANHNTISYRSDPPLAPGKPGLRVADAAMEGGAPAVALSVTDGVLATDPRNVAALDRKGNALYELNRPAEAAESYQRALTIAPGNVDALIGLGRIRLSTDPAAAEALLRRAAARQPRNAAAQNDLGIACDLQGRHKDAQLAYRRALAASPSEVAPQVNLGLSLALGGDAQRGVAMLQPLAAGNPTPRVRDDLAAALAMAGDSDQAERLLRPELSDEQVREAMMGFVALRQ
ncbi:MAG: tetratricopeptide repeat protein [Acidisphaera sp.]|nr:tetratricopeptide repeat protein [Acidisphaera sp.]